MPQFSTASKARLLTSHEDLQRLFNEIIKVRDCSIVCGHRGREDQTEAFRTGKSKVEFPNSMHNTLPSSAVDAIPYPTTQKDWNDRIFWIEWSSWVKGFANGMGINVRSGYDWDMDNNYSLTEQTFWDGPHFELIRRIKNG